MMKYFYALSAFIYLSIGLLSAQGLQLNRVTAFSPDANAVGIDIFVDSESNSFVSGVVQGSNTPLDMNPSDAPGDTAFAPPSSIFLAKYNSEGKYLWSHSFPGYISPGLSQNSGIALDSEGNVVITSGTNSRIDIDPSAEEFFIGRDDQITIYVIKYSADGRLLWSKEVPLIESRNGSTNHTVAFKGITFNKENEVVFSGTIYVNASDTLTFDFDPSGGGLTFETGGRANFYLGKINQAGDLSWAGIIKSSGNSNSDLLFDIATDGTDHIYISGGINGEGTARDFDLSSGEKILTIPAGTGRSAFIAKYDTDGQLKWAGITQDGLATGRNITVDEEGNVYQSGFYSNRVNFNLSSGGPVNIGEGTGNIYLCKYSPDGDFIWGYETPRTSAGSVNLLALHADQNGYIYMAGSIAGGFDFDFFEDENIIAAGSGNLPFIVKYDTDAGLIFTVSFAESFFSAAREISINDRGDVFVTGSFRDVVDFDPSENVFEVTGNSSNTVYVAKFSPCYFEETSVNLCEGDTLLVGNKAFTMGGTYPVSFSSSTGCDSTVVYQINLVPLPDNSISLSNGTLSLAQEGAQYGWYNCGTSVLILGETAATFTPTESGSYGALVVLNGCFSITECLEVVVSGLFDKSSGLSIKAHPNPTSSVLQFQIDRQETQDPVYRLMDMNGRTLLQERMTGNTSMIDLSDLPAGMYFLRIETNDGFSGSQKIVKF
jgi:hypothetical protein